MIFFTLFLWSFPPFLCIVIRYSYLLLLKNEVNKGLGANKKVVVAGCVPQVGTYSHLGMERLSNTAGYLVGHWPDIFNGRLFGMTGFLVMKPNKYPGFFGEYPKNVTSEIFTKGTCDFLRKIC